eukprot:COSAG05_NODE_1167_length_5631_cov_3.840383_6_plen_148_part_00
MQTYVTDRIVGMGWPSESYLEGSVRNRMVDVERFFATRHALSLGKVMVYNLCSERTYERDTRFAGPRGQKQWRRYGFPDHNAPPLELMEAFCEDAAGFLGADADAVIAVHCKAGKGRTGTMIAALLVCLPRLPPPKWPAHLRSASRA